MRRRLKKKKGLLKDPEYEKLKKRLFLELEEKAGILERRAEQTELPDCGQNSGKDGR